MVRVEWKGGDVIMWATGGDQRIKNGDILLMPEAEARSRQRAGQVVILPDEPESEAAPEPTPDAIEDVAETLADAGFGPLAEAAPESSRRGRRR